MQISSVEWALKYHIGQYKANYYKQAKSHLNVIREDDGETWLMKYWGGCVDNLLILLSVHVSNKNKQTNLTSMSVAFNSVA